MGSKVIAERFEDLGVLMPGCAIQATQWRSCWLARRRPPGTVPASIGQSGDQPVRTHVACILVSRTFWLLSGDLGVVRTAGVSGKDPVTVPRSFFAIRWRHQLIFQWPRVNFAAMGIHETRRATQGAEQRTFWCTKLSLLAICRFIIADRGRPWILNGIPILALRNSCSARLRRLVPFLH